MSLHSITITPPPLTVADEKRHDGNAPVEDSGIRRQSPTTGRPVIVFRTAQR